jgi:hypothetical protein
MQSVINYIRNQPIETDVPLIYNFFKLFGYNDYISEKAQRGSFGEVVQDVVTPPIKAFSPLTRDIVALIDGNDKTEYQGNAIKFIPFLGDTLYGQSSYGKKARLKKEKEIRDKKYKKLKEEAGL